MKIVINSCYGGFSLSPKGLRRYLELQGHNAYFYQQTKYKHSCDEVEYTRIDNIDDVPSLFFYCTTSDQGERISHYPRDTVSYYAIERNDPILVQVVEELGKESYGTYAKLQVVEIASGRWFKIDNYDGYETIEYRDIDDEWIFAQ